MQRPSSLPSALWTDWPGPSACAASDAPPPPPHDDDEDDDDPDAPTPMREPPSPIPVPPPPEPPPMHVWPGIACSKFAVAHDEAASMGHVRHTRGYFLASQHNAAQRRLIPPQAGLRTIHWRSPQRF